MHFRTPLPQPIVTCALLSIHSQVFPRLYFLNLPILTGGSGILIPSVLFDRPSHALSMRTHGMKLLTLAQSSSMDRSLPLARKLYRQGHSHSSWVSAFPCLSLCNTSIACPATSIEGFPVRALAHTLPLEYTAFPLLGLPFL